MLFFTLSIFLLYFWFFYTLDCFLFFYAFDCFFTLLILRFWSFFKCFWLFYYVLNGIILGLVLITVKMWGFVLTIIFKWRSSKFYLWSHCIAWHLKKWQSYTLLLIKPANFGNKHTSYMIITYRKTILLTIQSNLFRLKCFERVNIIMNN